MSRPQTHGGRPSESPHRARALLMAALLAVTALAAGIEVHSHREVLGADLSRHALQGERISLGASHPAAATHAEAAEVETTLRCPVCLLHLQSAGETAGDDPAAVRPAAEGRPAAADPLLPRAPHRLPGGSRAPPSAS